MGTRLGVLLVRSLHTKDHSNGLNLIQRIDKAPACIDNASAAIEGTSSNQPIEYKVVT